MIEDAPIIPAHPRCRCIYSAVVEIGDENVPVDGSEAGQEIALMQLTKKEKRLQTAAKNGIINTESPIKAVGADSPRIPNVKHPFTDLPLKFVPGKRPEYPGDHTMAGHGCKTGRLIDDIDSIAEFYNTLDSEKWQKEKARYWTFDEYGEERQVELHWYQHPDIGKVEYKVKVKKGRMYVDEWDD